jgi:hypothetical protein
MHVCSNAGLGAAAYSGKPVTPIIRMPTVVLEREDANLVWQRPEVDGVWETRHEVMTNICLDDATAFWRILNDTGVVKVFM